MSSECAGGSAQSAASSGRTGRSVSWPPRTRESSMCAVRPSAISRRTTASGSSGATPSRCTGSRCWPRSRASRSSCHRSPRNGGHEMQAYGMALDLHDDPTLIARYKKEHASVWPEVVARLREIGVSEMKIFLLGRRMLMYCETRDGFDAANDFARSTDDPTYRNWDELMRAGQERGGEARP